MHLLSQTILVGLAVALLRARRVWQANYGIVRVSELIMYPIKSCGGTSVKEAVVTPLGFENDRRWMIVDATSGEMVTQRATPKLALIKPTVTKDGKGVVLCARGMRDLVVPLVPRAPDSSNVRRVIVWDEPWNGVDQGEEAASWLTMFLKDDKGGDSTTPAYHLVYQDDTCIREITTPWKAVKPDRNSVSLSNRVSFADGQPYLIATTESLRDLNTRITSTGGTALPMNRFRPNIVTSGSITPWEEDYWYDVSMGECGLRFYGCSRCERCRLTTTDQDTGIQAGLDGEPLATLRTFRGVGRTGNVIFGTNLIPVTQTHVSKSNSSSRTDSLGVLHVGDVVTVNQRVFVPPGVPQ